MPKVLYVLIFEGHMWNSFQFSCCRSSWSPSYSCLWKGSSKTINFDNHVYWGLTQCYRYIEDSCTDERCSKSRESKRYSGIALTSMRCCILLNPNIHDANLEREIEAAAYWFSSASCEWLTHCNTDVSIVQFIVFYIITAGATATSMTFYMYKSSCDHSTVYQITRVTAFCV